MNIKVHMWGRDPVWLGVIACQLHAFFAPNALLAVTGKLHTTHSHSIIATFSFTHFFFFLPACLPPASLFTMRTIYVALGAGVIYFN